jgi:hypothetical protein
LDRYRFTISDGDGFAHVSEAVYASALAAEAHAIQIAKELSDDDSWHGGWISVDDTYGNWEFLETLELKRAEQEIRRLNGALDILSTPFPGHETLTPRERVALAQIIRGASSKEAGRTLGISPRPSIFIEPIC